MSGLPPGINLADNDQHGIIGSVSATWALAVTAILLRFTCRRISRAGFWWDDWLMIPAFLFTSVLTWVTVTWMINFGLGKHIFAQPKGRIPEAVTVFLKSLFIAEVCYTGTIVFAKFSILAFYWRLFSRNTFVRWSVIVITAIVTMWGLAVFLIVVTQCRPLRGFWDKTIPAQCTVDSKKFFYGNSVPNIITDIFLLLAPMPAIWSLKLEMKQKVSLSGIFLLGGFITGVSITRLIYLVTLDIQSQDVTWVFRMPQIWTCVELNIAVVCGCLPQLRPLILLITTGSPMSGTNAGTKKATGMDRSNASGGKRSSRSFFSSAGTSQLGAGTKVEPQISVAGSEEFTEKASSDTRPLVYSGAVAKAAGYIELGSMENAKAQQSKNNRSGTSVGPGAWDTINVQKAWDVRIAKAEPHPGQAV